MIYSALSARLADLAISNTVWAVQRNDLWPKVLPLTSELQGHCQQKSHPAVRMAFEQRLSTCF